MNRPTRRGLLGAAMLTSLAGCSILDDILETNKPPVPGKRETVLSAIGAAQADLTDRRPVNLPPAAVNAEWSQAGGVASHVMGNLAVGDVKRSWSRSIGEGGGYRRKITAAPVIAGGAVFTMDSDGMVSAFDAAGGTRRWTTDTEADNDRSTNVGGGLAAAGGRVFASTGRGEIMSLDAATGKIGWRTGLDAPARSAPTLVERRLFVATIDERMLAFDAATGKRAWSYQAATSDTSVLGLAAPAYADGLLVAGFGSGDLTCLRAESGTLAWSDSLAAARGRNSLLDLSAIRALPVIANGIVYVIGLGGQIVSLDLRSGRRLWERDVAGQNTPWLAGDWLFVVTEEQILLCINCSDGRVRWATELPHYGDPEKKRDSIFWSGPLLAGKFLYLAGSTEKLIAVNAATGEMSGQQDLPDPVAFAPVAAMGKMFIVTNDGTLSAFG